jgi:two-component system phosphate regulon sensor histidine kinase PhoR
LLAGALGGATGYWLGALIGWPVVFSVSLAAAAVLALSVRDALQGLALLDWLRNPDEARPELTGVWKEVGLRVERLVRLHQQALDAECARLDQFLSAIEASPNGVLLLDATDHITWVSAAAADHFGLNQQRDLQQRVTNLVRQPAFVQYLSIGDFRIPFKMPLSHGSQTWLQIQVQVYGEGLKLVLSQDITERERSDTMRRDFVANVSHEIRTPLTVLNGFIETLSALPLTEVERKRVIALMAQQAERMQHLVADLLTLAQIEGSPRPASDRWVKVSSLLQRIESDAHGLSRERHAITVFLDASEQDVEVSGVDSEWLSAIGNLVSNAVRYTPQGQPIEVRWAPTEEGGGELSVRDHGIGIDSEHIPRLTERFYRVDGSRSRDTGGTGLGLSIVKHVTQRHGGELKITSEKGKGSVFTLQIPAVRVRRA